MGLQYVALGDLEEHRKRNLTTMGVSQGCTKHGGRPV